MSVNGFSTEDDSRGSQEHICCLIENGQRCNKPAGCASYNKRVQKTVAQKKLQFQTDTSLKHNYICDYHKGLIQSMRTKRKRKDSDDDTGSNDHDDQPEVDLYQLQVNTLRRYKRYYKVQTRPGINKAQLADTLQKHFKTIPVSQKEVLSFFIYVVKNNANKLEHKNGDSPTS